MSDRPRIEDIEVPASASAGDLPTVNATGDGLEYAAPATGSAHVIQDEGTPLTQRANLDFVGTGVAVTDDGVDTTTVTISSGGTSTLGTLGYAAVSANQGSIGTSGADLTGLTVTVTVASGRRIRISWQGFFTPSASGIVMDITAQEGATVLQHSQRVAAGNTNGFSIDGAVILTPSAGSHTYKLRGVTGSGTMTLNASATLPAFILVEDIGT